MSRRAARARSSSIRRHEGTRHPDRGSHVCIVRLSANCGVFEARRTRYSRDEAGSKPLSQFGSRAPECWRQGAGEERFRAEINCGRSRGDADRRRGARAAQVERLKGAAGRPVFLRLNKCCTARGARLYNPACQRDTHQGRNPGEQTLLALRTDFSKILHGRRILSIAGIRRLASESNAYSNVEQPVRSRRDHVPVPSAVLQRHTLSAAAITQCNRQALESDGVMSYPVPSLFLRNVPG